MAASEADLHGLRVLVTRPEAAGQRLTAALIAAGAEARQVPLLQTVPIEPSRATLNAVQNLDGYGIVIVTSLPAVAHGLRLLGEWWPQWPVGLQWWAVGASTAAALRAAGLPAQSPDWESSEGLLARPELQQVAGQKVLILCGEGGRELIAEGLRARGAQVDRAEVYRRELPPATPAALAATLADWRPQMVVLTSAEALAHWQMLAGSDVAALPLLVVSERIAALARAGGAAEVIVAAGARDAAVLAALNGWWQSRNRGR